MQLAKRIMAGVLGLAVCLGACFVFVGCNKVKGNEYAFKSLTFTIITELEDAGKAGTKDAEIKTTRTLSAREFYLWKKEGVSLENLATQTTDATDEEILEWCVENYLKTNLSSAYSMVKSAKRTQLSFKSKEVELKMESEPNKNTGSISKDISTAKYTLKDGVIEMTMTETDENQDDARSEYISYMYVSGENIEQRYTAITEAENYADEGVYMVSIVYAEV